MQDLLNNFGVNGFLLTAQIVNFLIVLYLLKRFAFGPILKLLKDRKATIEESLKNAEQTEKLLAQAEEKEKDVLKKAQAQAQAMLSDAKKQSVELQKQAEDQTKERIERMLVDAQKKINEQTQKAEKDLATQVTKLSIDMLEKSLKGFFSEKDQEEVLKKAVKQMKA